VQYRVGFPLELEEVHDRSYAGEVSFVSRSTQLPAVFEMMVGFM
jgi:hypothetical protein